MEGDCLMQSTARSLAVYLSVDMEGCADVVSWDEVRPSASPEYARARRIMTGETNAAIAGAGKAGATGFTVNDAHSTMQNLLADDLDPRAALVTGTLKPLYMLEAIQTSRFDAAFFIGYHAGVHVGGAVMAHSYSPRVIYECRLNGVAVGEITINAALAGHYGVPVALVTGDQHVVAETKRFLPWAVTVQTKTSYSASAANSLSPQRAREAIAEGARRAVEDVDGMQPFALSAPATMELDLMVTSQADACAMLPGASRIADRTLRFTGAAFPELFKALVDVVHIAAAAA